MVRVVLNRSGYGVIPEQTVKYVNFKAYRLAKTFGLNSQDEEDLRQDLFVYALEKLAHWDERRGRSLASFLQMCIDSKLKNVVRDAQRMKRRNIILTLDAPCGTDNSVDDGGTVIDHIAGVVGRRQEEVDRICDIRAVVGSLDDELATVCRMLKKGNSQREIAKRLERSRKYVAETLMPRLRDKFAELKNS